MTAEPTRTAHEVWISMLKAEHEARIYAELDDPNSEPHFAADCHVCKAIAEAEGKL